MSTAESPEDPSRLDRLSPWLDRLATEVLSTLFALLWWLFLLGATMILSGLVYLLPRVGDFENPRSLISVGLAMMLFGGGLVSLANLSARRSKGDDLQPYPLRRMIDVLGLWPGGRQAAKLAVYGLLAGAVNLGLSWVVVVAHQWVSPPDGRNVLTSADPSIPARLAEGFILAPPFEELLWRGTMLGLAMLVLRYLRPRLPRTATAVVVALIIGSSVLFGWWHSNFGMENVVTASILGLLAGGLVERCF